MAVGIRRALRSRPSSAAGPVFVGGLGVGLIIAGIFHPDPGFGYPIGTPSGPPKVLTYHSTLHGLGFTMSFLCFVLACAFLTRPALARRQWGVVAFSLVAALASLILAMTPGDKGIAVRDLVAAGLSWTWVTITSGHLILSMRPQSSYSVRPSIPPFPASPTAADEQDDPILLVGAKSASAGVAD